MTNYTWRRKADGKEVVFDGPNACHNIFCFANLSDEQLAEMARMLERSFWAGGESARSAIRDALGVSK